MAGRLADGAPLGKRGSKKKKKKTLTLPSPASGRG
jgi:hypothetical protein